jgi:uncharacterized protein YajQ (UPF0234 family)
MPQEYSFDIVSRVDLQEIDNAVNQATKEIKTRFDFKGSKAEFSLDRDEKKIKFLADDELKLTNMIGILQEKLAKRGVSIKTLKYGPAEKALDGFVRQTADIIQGIPQDQAKEIVKKVKELKIKVQPSIQGDQIRISGRSKDDLQLVVQMLKSENIPLPLQFVNYR